MVPEWDREYSQYYFTFLQCYRVKLSSLMTGVCAGMSDFARLATDKEDAAADPISLLPPESVLAAGKRKPYKYIKTQQAKKDLMQDSPPRQTLERSLIA